MNAARAATVLGYLRRLGGAGMVRASSDAELLERFAVRREDAAFTELVRRHGPMVLGVCRRVLGNPHDAEDAFQATFLVLAARPRAVGDPSSLANWLFGVARRTALRARVDAARRYRHQLLGAKAEAAAPAAESLWCDLRPVLDAEVARLPARCREAFVLCCLEGRTHAEAGRLLGCPGGTVASRLSRARERLRGRLARRGLTLGTAGILLAGEAEAAVSAALLGVLVRAASARAATTLTAAGAISPRVAALTEGVLRAMWTTKLKMVAVLVLAVGAAGFGAGLVLNTAAQPVPGTSAGQPASPAGGTGDKGAGQREVVAPADPKPRPPAGATSKPPEEEKKVAESKAEPRHADIEDAEDEVELAKARLEAKQAELAAAKAVAEHAKTALARADELMSKRVIDEETYDTFKGALDAALAQVRIKEADLREPEIRYRQARRRLVALRQAAGTDETTGRPAGKPVQAKEQSPQADDARDAIELTEAQLQVQCARVAEAQGELETAKANLARLGRLGGAVSAEEKAQVEATVRSKEGQMRIREAEMAEAEVRLKHARRKADEIGKAASPAKDAERIEELQKKVERLQKELDTLKKR